MKKLTTVSVQVFGRHDGPYTRGQLIAFLDEHLEVLSEDERKTAKFEMDEYGYAYDDNTYHAVFMRYQRLETDEEEQKREAEEAHYSIVQLARERAEFERLLKKFGGQA